MKKSKSFRLLQYISISTFLFSFIACTWTHNVEPVPVFIENDLLPAINDLSNPVAIINAHSETGVTEIMSAAGIHSWIANRKQMTDVAVAVAVDALKRKYIKIDQNSTKVLKLSVPMVSCAQVALNFKCEITIYVKTGDGVTKTYEGYDYFGNGYMTTAAIEQSIRMAVSEMFKDPEIITYLKN